MNTILKATGVIIAGLTLSLLNVKAVRAGTVHNNWYYAFDSLTDSITGNDVGGTKYEIAGMAYGQQNGQSIFVISTKLPLEGTTSAYADDGIVALGDILINSTTDSFNVASEKGNLRAIHLVLNNAAGVSSLGFYENVIAKSVTTANGLALANVGAYHNHVQNNGGTPSMGDLALNTSQIDSSQHILNVIASGDLKGNINLLDANALQNLGYDSSFIGREGYNTIAVGFDSSLLPDGQFTALWSPECGNDIMSLIYGKTTKKVPESSNTLGLLVVGAAGTLIIKNRKKSSVVS
ncbi:XDD3 family exosortase-dependent surface protein [Anabaena sp. UHCC 0451]|uniref:XDD3 family exosortase-dependent surface protein n=1 Tax=Anabaena sp. UHCC 0451 TaxID=2055235 RepID=UPI002B210423|nr:XDD3 family exosortase-dependent surface protein [Anabaena sp. UHCC 0451]MEA5576541.1 XDD3 family exosortase-dependent surface protein [Anabaena sp. UHCC 0451]